MAEACHAGESHAFQANKCFQELLHGMQGIWQAKWNFSKWLVDKQGMPVKHYDSNFDAAELERDIAAELLRST